MTREEFLTKTAKIILDDWRKWMLENDSVKERANLPGDTIDISYRAFQKAEEIAQDFYD